MILNLSGLMGPKDYDARRDWIDSHRRGHTIFILEALSLEVEYSALVCIHNYSLCCDILV